MGILSSTANEAPEAGNQQVKFLRPGDAILGVFKSRKTGIKTKVSESAAVTTALIVDSTISGVDKGATMDIFEAKHVRDIMDNAQLSPGAGFVLRFAEEDRKTRFKKFYFKQLTSDELAEEAEANGVDLGEEAAF